MYLTRDIEKNDPDSRLETFLFPHSRRPIPTKLRNGLGHLQSGRCFWCNTTEQVEVVDHVVPWSRSHNESVPNLVLTDARCNNTKSDLAIAPRLARRWLQHLHQNRDQLERLAEASNTPSDEPLTRAWASSAMELTMGSETLAFDVTNSKPTQRNVTLGAFDINWMKYPA